MHEVQDSTNMDSSKPTALLIILMVTLSTMPQTLAACEYCPKSPPKSPKSPKSPNSPKSPKSPKSPTSPTPPAGNPITLPPFGLPKLPPFGLPKLPMPPVGLPKLPPMGLPPILGTPPSGNGGKRTPPSGNGGRRTRPSPSRGKSSCPSPPPPAAKESCPIDALKLGACVDLLGNTVHVGDRTVECCPVLDGLVGVAAAVCLCTAIKAKLLDINVYLPIALQVVVACGSSVPAGYTCA